MTEAQQQNADELGTVLPDATVHVGGRSVTVHELRFAQSLRATPVARPIIESLRALMDRHGEDIPAGDLVALLTDHPDAWLDLLALATGESAEWIAGLSDADGLALQMALWEVNQRFFVQRLVLGGVMAQQLAGRPRSSASSSTPATAATPPNSPSGSPGARSHSTGTPPSSPETGDEQTSSRP